jgi:hypothetical protein
MTVKAETINEPPAEVKSRQRTKKLCALCASGWPTTYRLNGIQLFECRRKAPSEADRPGQRAYWKLTLATEGCGDWQQR